MPCTAAPCALDRAVAPSDHGWAAYYGQEGLQCRTRAYRWMTLVRRVTAPGASAMVAGVSVPNVDGIVFEAGRLWAVPAAERYEVVLVRR